MNTFEEKFERLREAGFWKSNQEFTLDKVAHHMRCSASGASTLMTKVCANGDAVRHETRKGSTIRLTFTPGGYAKRIAYGPWRKHTNEQLGIDPELIRR